MGLLRELNFLLYTSMIKKIPGYNIIELDYSIKYRKRRQICKQTVLPLLVGKIVFKIELGALKLLILKLVAYLLFSCIVVFGPESMEKEKDDASMAHLLSWTFLTSSINYQAHKSNLNKGTKRENRNRGMSGRYRRRRLFVFFCVRTVGEDFLQTSGHRYKTGHNLQALDHSASLSFSHFQCSTQMSGSLEVVGHYPIMPPFF